jgi:WD40 repeat protein
MYQEVVTFVGHSGKVEALTISPTGKIMARYFFTVLYLTNNSGGHDFNIFLWELNLPYKRESEIDELHVVKPIAQVNAHRGHITTLSFNQNGEYLASCSTDHGIIVWHVVGKKLKKIWENEHSHGSVVSSVCSGKKSTAHLVFIIIIYINSLDLFLFMGWKFKSLGLYTTWKCTFKNFIWT